MADKVAAAWPISFTTRGTDANGVPVNITFLVDANGKLTVQSVTVFPPAP